MSSDTSSFPLVTAFVDFRRIDAGPREAVLERMRERADAASALIFDDHSGERVEFDLRPTADTEAASPSPGEHAPARGVGRPKLGVVAREVTLLPRHWDWLSRQPGGASVALRRLIDEARRSYAQRDAVRAAREAAYRVMSTLGSSLPGFEEAARSLFAGDRARFHTYVSDWPADLAAYLRQLSEDGWASPSSTTHD
ncbi:MAG: DUF2239 family protein [Comamonadaceae bacterium]|nr:MAG: DUF2239 family protein [Comamonadaceae bacterium]